MAPRMRIALLLLSLVAVSFCQTGPFTVAESDSGTVSGVPEPWFTNGETGFILSYPTITGLARIDPGYALVFDVQSPFASDPVYAISVRWCDGACADDQPWTSLGIITASSSGDSTAGNFLVSFVVENLATRAVDPSYPQFRFLNVAGSQQAATGVLVGNAAFTADTWSYTSGVSAGGTAPAIEIYDCGAYDPESCTITGSSLDPTLDNEDGVCSAQLSFNLNEITPDETFFGRCPLTLTSNAPDENIFPVGSTTVTFTFSNAYAPGNNATCDTIVTVNDNERPVAACPDDMTFRPVEGECEFNTTGTLLLPVPQASDNCPAFNISLSPDLDIASLEVGENDFDFNVTDGAGFTDQCSFTYTVELNYFVRFAECPEDDADRIITLNNIDGTCVAEANFTSQATLINNCTDDTILDSTRPIEGFNYTVGNNTQVLSVTGDNGTITCTYIVQVLDTEEPTITCPADVNVTTFGDDQLVRLPPPQVDDNCGPRRVTVTSNYTTGPRFPVGTTTVEYTADDGVFESTCTFDVIVTQLIPSPSPAQRPVSFPSVTPTNTQTRDLPAGAGPIIEPPSVSRSNTPTRSRNPSLSPTPSPSPTRTPSPQRSDSSSRTPTPSPSRSSSPSPSRSATPSPSNLDVSKSPYIPSASPSPTPGVPSIIFVQQDAEALLEIRIPCARSTCTREEVQSVSDQFASSLGIPTEDIEVVSVFGREATVLVCGSDRIAEVANAFNADQTNGIFVENINWEANCRNIRVGILSSAASHLIVGILGALTLVMLA